jgi:tRNA pseudouridine55 synthase
MDGVLVVDKPSGPTSHDVVAHARRALGVRRVGHIGTLDPIATGVLPLVVGRATRLASLLSGGPKTYDGNILLGVSTDTYDTTGKVIADARDRAGTGLVNAPDRQAIEHAVQAFVGTRLQQPPPFSAKKIRGVRAYKLARRNQPVAPDPVSVTVHAIDVLEVEETRVRCRVTCDSGFYMRALAHELGTALGCGACLQALRRERNGEFDLSGAVPLDEIAARGPAVADRMVPLAELLPEVPRLVLTDHGARRARHGNDLTAADVISSSVEWTAGMTFSSTGVAKLYDGDGTLIAIAKADAARLLHPTIVLV